MTLELALRVLTMVFVAGGAVMAVRLGLKQVTKDVNGVGAAMRRQNEQAQARHATICAALVCLAKPEDQVKIAELLKD